MAKSPAVKPKALYYRRAEWKEKKEDKTLEAMLKEAHESYSTVGSRTFPGTNGTEMRGADHNPDDKKGIFLQIASYTPEQPTSTIEKATNKKRSAVEAQEAPEGKNYLDGEVFALVKDNHVILCPSGAREGLAQNYFLKILNQAGFDHVAASLNLDKIAKTSKINMIQKEGVKEVVLDSSLYEASLLHSKKNNEKVSGIKAQVAAQLKRIFAKDPELKDIEDKENVNIKISLTFDGKEARTKDNSKDPSFGVAGRARLKKTSEHILSELENDHEEGFKIITGANNTITSDEIRVADTKRIKTSGKSLNKSDAWDKIFNYYSELNKSGVLKQ